jgi:hypothetical protein
MEENLLIIIGRISFHKNSCSVRILFDIEKDDQLITVYLNQIVRNIQLNSKKSHIEIFDDLKLDFNYEGIALFEDKKYSFQFNTTNNPNIAYVSCCGYYSIGKNGNIDTDDKTLKKLADEKFDLMIHMGDQIYADHIKAIGCLNPENEYRQLYRKVFGSNIMQKILRKGSHIMICDDHEFYNAVNNLNKNDPYCIAARNMYIEYQESLWGNEYSKCKNITFNKNNIIIPNIRFESVFNYDKDNPFISEVLQTDVIMCLKKKCKNVIVTSLPILANNKIGSWLKSKIDKYSQDDSTLPKHSKNTINFLDKIRESNCEIILVSGNLHFSSKSDIFYENKKIAKQYISSGLSKKCTINNNKFYYGSLLIDKINLGKYKLGKYKSTFKIRKYDTNYTLIMNDNTVKQYVGNNFPIKNFHNKHFHKINIVVGLLIFKIIH